MPATRTPKNKNTHPLQDSSGFSPAPGCALTYPVVAIPILRHVQSFVATARLITAAFIYSERFLFRPQVHSSSANSPACSSRADDVLQCLFGFGMNTDSGVQSTAHSQRICKDEPHTTDPQ
jgi:hypothetical protein